MTVLAWDEADDEEAAELVDSISLTCTEKNQNPKHGELASEYLFDDGNPQYGDTRSDEREEEEDAYDPFSWT